MIKGLNKRLARTFTPGRKKGYTVLLIALALFALWQLSPFQPVQALASLTDPEKLATLGARGANERVNKIVFWLHEARSKGISADTAVRWAQKLNGTKEPQASLVHESLLRNLKIADELLLFNPGNRERLRRGYSAKIVRGPYAGDSVEIDHIVPLSLAPEVGNELANLEMMPKALNRQKSDTVTTRQLEHARKLHAAGLLKKETLDRISALTQKSPFQREEIRSHILQ